MKKAHVQRIAFVLVGIVLGALLTTGTGLADRANAQPARPPAGAAFDGVEIIRFGDHGFLLFDRATGKFWRYDVRTEKGFPYQRFGGGWQIDTPGSEPRPIQ